tara:strand:+ start:168 stop:827 length:660 start_codon:yes stop_codon:yes gene_type:complete
MPKVNYIKKYSHIIWDWNGTIIDDTALCVSIVNEILRARGLPQLSIEQYREQFDFPVREYYKKLGLPGKGSEFNEISSHFIEKYNILWKECPLQKYAREVVSKIKSMSLYQSLLSAGKEDHVKSFVRHHNLHDYFFAVVGTTNIYAEGKIDRATHFFNNSGLKNQRYLLIGDTLHDHEVAQALGIDCLLFSKGHHSEKKLAQAGVPIISQLDQLLEWVS